MLALVVRVLKVINEEKETCSLYLLARNLGFALQCGSIDHAWEYLKPHNCPHFHLKFMFIYTCYTFFSFTSREVCTQACTQPISQTGNSLPKYSGPVWKMLSTITFLYTCDFCVYIH